MTAETSSGAGDAVDTAAETFLTNGLSKVFKINNICDYTHLSDCGIPNTIITLNGSKLESFTTNYATLSAFGTSWLLFSLVQKLLPLKRRRARVY